MEGNNLNLSFEQKEQEKIRLLKDNWLEINDCMFYLCGKEPNIFEWIEPIDNKRYLIIISGKCNKLLEIFPKGKEKKRFNNQYWKQKKYYWNFWGP